MPAKLPNSFKETRRSSTAKSTLPWVWVWRWAHSTEILTLDGMIRKGSADSYLMIEWWDKDRKKNPKSS